MLQREEVKEYLNGVNWLDIVNGNGNGILHYNKYFIQNSERDIFYKRGSIYISMFASLILKAY